MVISELFDAGVFEQIYNRKIVSFLVQTFLVLYIAVFGIYFTEARAYIESLYARFVVLPQPGSFWYIFTDRSSWDRRCSFTEQTIGVAILLLIECSRPLQILFSTSPFQWLGKHSFGIYLIHFVLQNSIAIHIMLFISQIEMLDGDFTRSVITYVVTFVAMIPLLYVFYYTADRFSVLLGKRAVSIFWTVIDLVKSRCRPTSLAWAKTWNGAASASFPKCSERVETLDV